LDDVPLQTLLLAGIALLLVSAFFSISETSMMALNRYRLKHLIKTGSRGARLASDLLAQTDKLLGVVLIGNNLVNAAVAALATLITFRVFGQSELALSLATVAVTFLLVVFSEITPKVIGASYPERIAFPAAFVLRPLLQVLYPVVWFVNLFVRGLLTLLRLTPTAAGPEISALSPEELRTLVLEGGHFLPAKHQKILLNLFDLQSITVDDLMTPRNQIEVVDIDADAAELERQLKTSNHTRMPVYRESLDNIIGLLHVRKVLNLGADEVRAESLMQIMRPPYFVPQGTPLLAQLQNFQEEEERLGLVVDEYGELMGLITLEDILEEIIGEFTTQSPLQSGGINRQTDGSVLVEGVITLRQLNRKLGVHFPLDGPKTLNGLILEHLEDIPEPGTTVKIAGHPIEIVQTQDRAVRSARIYPVNRPN
jgi:magnesium and cobalt exporter, CNNM family